MPIPPAIFDPRFRTDKIQKALTTLLAHMEFTQKILSMELTSYPLKYQLSSIH